MMGLDQTSNRSPSQGFSADEMEERQKLYISLYIRDRFQTTIRGTPCWLPSIKPQGCFSPSQSPTDDNNDILKSMSSYSWPMSTEYAAELALARIQSDLHHIALATNPIPLGFDYCRAVLRVQRDLTSWSQKYNVPASVRPTSFRDVCLHLAYFSTCIRLQPLLDTESGDGENEASPASTRTRLLDFSRLCCLLVVSRCTPLDQMDTMLVSKLDSLLNETSNGVDAAVENLSPLEGSPKSPRMVTGQTPPRPTTNVQWGDNCVSLLSVHRVAAFLPAIAIFLLSREILATEGKDLHHHDKCFDHTEDIRLLESLASCLASSPVLTEKKDSYPSKLHRITQLITDTIKTTAQNMTGAHATYDSVNCLSMPMDVDVVSKSAVDVFHSINSNHSEAPSDLTSSSTIATSTAWSDSVSWTWDPQVATPSANLPLSGSWFDSLDFSRFIDTSPTSNEKHMAQNWDNSQPSTAEMFAQLQQTQPGRPDFDRVRKRSRHEVLLDA